MAGSFFGEVRKQGETLQAEQKAQRERLATKKRRIGEDEAAPGCGDSAVASGHASGDVAQARPDAGTEDPPKQAGPAVDESATEKLKSAAKASVTAASTLSPGKEIARGAQKEASSG
ncbi:unnamed protein product [Prorocentrum cordatum]|uniref:Uncharacterized protein n=1 Tax=Prorocentrum cordatum TaxID=2364126 RepID=A0ABN9UN10_9DINO|nr:unnamed protein product [Polarella glacialis]